MPPHDLDSRRTNNRSPATAARMLYSGLAVGLLAVMLGWFAAHGPDAARRPLLTPAVIGVLCGLATHALLADASPLARRLLPAAAVVLALATLHVSLFRQIERAAKERVAGHPADLLGLQLHEQTADSDPAAELQRRKLRLALRPTWRDYLTERATVLLGEVPWPIGAVMLGVELLLAGAAGVCLALKLPTTHPQAAPV